METWVKVLIGLIVGVFFAVCSVITDVRGEIINSLGLFGDGRAVPVLKKYLKKPPKYTYVFTGNVAYALYQITGKSYKYKDRDGKMKLFQAP